MTDNRYSIEPETRKYVKGYGFLSFARKYKKQILHKRLDTSKKVVHRASEFINISIIKRFNYIKICDKKWIEVND